MSKDPVPTPYVAIPTKEWDGIDGNWSTFRVSVGSDPGQDFRVLVSTEAATVFMPASEACETGNQSCPSSRGVQLFKGQPSSGFQQNESSTWNLTGIYSLDLESTPLNYPDDRGYFGFDKVCLGFSQNNDAIEVDSSLAVGYSSTKYWVGMLGLNNAETNLDSQAPIPSLIQVLNDTHKIPSLSYGYTAGAHYRYKSVPGSLVLGGYDKSRFESHVYNFTFADTPDRMLRVGLQSIYTSFSLTDLGKRNLATSHMTTIDSTVSHLWLPGDTCDMFAEAFGLTYDEAANYYLINDTMHNKLLEKNPTLTFTLADEEISSNATENIQINLPYAAFDLSIKNPAYPNTTNYFPIRRSKDDSQNTIGRVFLQEAYLIVDYERKIFSLAQANFTATMPEKDIRTIYSADYVSSASPSTLSGGAKAGIAIGVIAGVLLLFSAVYLYWWRPRKQKKKAHNKRPSVVSQASTYLSSADPPPNYYREGKEPYDPHFGTPQQQQQHMGYERQHSVSEMPAGADNQARRPELDGVNVGGSSYELPAPVKERDEDVVVYEMGVGHEATSDADQDSAEVENEEVERRGSEQRRPSEPPRPSQVETPPA